MSNQESDKVNESLDFCRTAPSADQARAENEDEPCNDFRSETGSVTPEEDVPGLLKPRQGDALLLVDIQNDFLGGGALEVPGGEEVVPVLKQYMKVFEEKGLPIIAARDWHPEGHSSFKAQGGLWPPHCVQRTPGAAFAPNLHLPGSAVIISTGVEIDEDGYSGFEDEALRTHLENAEVQRLWIGGLATDYCVRYTVLESLRRGYRVFLLEDAIRAVNVSPGDGREAIDEMKANGAKLATLSAITG